MPAAAEARATPINEYYVNKSTARLALTEMGPQEPIELAEFKGKLPSPAQLDAALRAIPMSSLDDSQAKGSSFIEGSSADDRVITYQYVTYKDHILMFRPNYDPPQADDYAYKFYKWDLSGYSGPPTVGIMWEYEQNPPSGECSILVCNFDDNSTEMYAYPVDHVLTLPAMDPYLNDNDEMVIGVMVRNTSFYNLCSLNMGTYEMRGTGAGEYFADTNYNVPDLAPALDLPDAVDLDSYLPPIGDQGGSYSCVAWALAYGCLNAELAHAYNIPSTPPYTGSTWDISDSHFYISPRHCYLESLYWAHMGEVSQEEAISQNILMDVLLSTGTYTEFKYPFTWEVGGQTIDHDRPEWWVRNYDPDYTYENLLLDIEDYWWLANDSESSAKINNIKTLLALHERPISVSMNHYDFNGNDDFTNLYANYNANDPSTYPYVDNITPGSDHALVIVGYNDGVGPGGCFKVRNSWGVDWMEEAYDNQDGGYFWITYSAFANNFEPMMFLKEEYRAETCAHYTGSVATITPPVNVDATEGDFNDHVKITWDAIPGVSGYRVFRDSKTVPLPGLIRSTTYNDYFSPDGKAHTYFVAALYNAGSMTYVGPLSRPEIGWIHVFANGTTYTSTAESLAVQVDRTGRINYSWVDTVPTAIGSDYRINQAVEQTPGSDSFVTNMLFSESVGSGVTVRMANAAYTGYRNQEGMQCITWLQPDPGGPYVSPNSHYLYQLQEDQAHVVNEGLIRQNFKSAMEEGGPDKTYLAVNPANDLWHIVTVDDANQYHGAMRTTVSNPEDPSEWQWSYSNLAARDLDVLSIKGKSVTWTTPEAWRIVERAMDPGNVPGYDKIQLYYGCPFLGSILFTRLYATNGSLAPKPISIAFNTSSSFCDTAAHPMVFTVGFSNLNENLATISIVGAANATDTGWDYHSIEWCTTNGPYNIVRNHGKFGDAIYIPGRDVYACAYLSGVQTTSYGPTDIGDLKLAVYSSSGWTIQTISQRPVGNSCAITRRGNEIVVVYTGYDIVTSIRNPSVILWTEN